MNLNGYLPPYYESQKVRPSLLRQLHNYQLKQLIEYDYPQTIHHNYPILFLLRNRRLNSNLHWYPLSLNLC